MFAYISWFFFSICIEISFSSLYIGLCLLTFVSSLSLNASLFCLPLKIPTRTFLSLPSLALRSAFIFYLMIVMLVLMGCLFSSNFVAMYNFFCLGGQLVALWSVVGKLKYDPTRSYFQPEAKRISTYVNCQVNRKVST